MFDDDHRVARVGQAMQHIQQFLDVGKVETCGRFVQDIDRVPRCATRQLLGQFDALSLASRKGSRALPKLDISQTHIGQRLELALDLGDVAKVLQGFVHIHVQRVGDAFALVADLERFAIEARALADVASYPHVGQEVHLDLFLAVALASLAAAALDVEAEPTRLVAPGLGLGNLGKDLADIGVYADIGGGVRTRGAADWILGDADDFADMLQAFDSVVLSRFAAGVVQSLGQSRVQRLGNQRGFPAARDAGHTGEQL